MAPNTDSPGHVLIIRFSAMGDVAMSIPVVYSVCRSYPDIHFTFLTKRSMGGMFVCPPSNLTVVAENLDDYRGVAGMWRLYRRINERRRIDAVADLHDVLRSKILRLAAAFHGVKAACIDKGRRDKRKLVRARNKVMRPLATSHARYREVFDRLGLTAPDSFSPLFGEGGADPAIFSSVSAPKREGEIWIGIAPFAAHRGKIYPSEKMESVVGSLYRRGVKLFFFGGGETERKVLGEWAERYPGAVSLAEKRLGFALELALQNHLDAMICMDSGNMHLAALTGTPTISVWGATHPYCGFTALSQNPELTVQADMDCRPCSVFGNKPCRYGDYRCMESIRPEEILEKVGRLLKGRLNLSESKEKDSK